MFGTNENYKPSAKNSPLMWVAEYEDLSYLSEYDLKTGKENDLKNVDKENLVRFGLVGDETKLYYEVYGGIFKVMGRMIQINYRQGDKVYPLVGSQRYCRDVIQNKAAEFYANFNYTDGALSNVEQIIDPSVTQYAYGFKDKFTCYGVVFSLSVTCEVLYTGIIQMHVILQTDMNLDGRLEIFKNGALIDSFLAPLPAYEVREILWQVK